MIAFLPVSLFKVKYHLGLGRPYSRFDRLVLQAIGGGVNELVGLVDTFRVHRRMIIETVVTLMGAGWVGIDPQSGQFGLSLAGRGALSKRLLPEDTAVVERNLPVLMERVTGQLCPVGDATFQDRRKLEPVWHDGVPIPKSDIPNAVTTGMVLPFLRP